MKNSREGCKRVDVISALGGGVASKRRECCVQVVQGVRLVEGRSGRGTNACNEMRRERRFTWLGTSGLVATLRLPLRILYSPARRDAIGNVATPRLTHNIYLIGICENRNSYLASAVPSPYSRLEKLLHPSIHTMNHVRATRPLWRHAASRRTSQVSRRTYAAEPASPLPPSSPPNPNTPPKEPSRVVRHTSLHTPHTAKPPHLPQVPNSNHEKQGAYYGSFGSPYLKCFLGALFTYQLAYYSWMKLEAVEEAHDKKTEIRDLQIELREALERQKERVGEVVDAVGDVVDETREKLVDGARSAGAVREVAKGGWWPW